MPFRSLVLFTLLTLAAASRSVRIGSSFHDAQQQTRSSTNAFEGSAEVQSLAEVSKSDVESMAKTKLIPLKGVALARFERDRSALSRSAHPTHGGAETKQLDGPNRPGHLALLSGNRRFGERRGDAKMQGQNDDNDFDLGMIIRRLVHSVFNSFDTDGSGSLRAEQLMGALHALRLNPRELQNFVFVDDDGSEIEHDSVVCSESCFFDVVLKIATGSVLGRRSLLTAGAVGVGSLMPLAAEAKIDSTNPANNYYFPQAKFRYLPRIQRSWIALDEVAPLALEREDWEALYEIWRAADDTTTCLPLYTSAIEGSRSTKRKKKSDTQKELAKITTQYKKACADLDKYVGKKDIKNTRLAVMEAHDLLLNYRMLAKIDKQGGGVIEVPQKTESGLKAGYVIPSMRGGGLKTEKFSGLI